MNIASIDIGSNTVLLLITSINDKSITTILNKYESPRLGKGLIPGKNIQKDRIEHLIDILQNYKALADKHNCEHIIVTATNALRIASNSNEIIQKIKSSLGLNVEIISGDKEAELSFMGASSSFNQVNDKLVIDIGGGSTEIIWGNNSNILYKESFQIGVVSLTERFLSKFPLNTNSIYESQKFLKNIFKPIKVLIPEKIFTIAVAGTPTTLSCINQNLKIYIEEKVEGSCIKLNELNKIYNEMYNFSPAQIKVNYGSVVDGREDVIFAGILILKEIIDLINIDTINISSRGLRYGNIINYINLSK